MEQINDYLQKIITENPLKIILSNPCDKKVQYKKIVITKKAQLFQVEKFTEKQVFHQNIKEEDLFDELNNFLKDSFLQLNSFHEAVEYGIKISKKGKVLFTKSKPTNQISVPDEHNRKKNYIFEEGQLIEPLIDMGVFTKEGKVVQSMYDKFKQINRFIEMVDDVVKESGIEEFTVIDFGCGKSYLTFLLYYYFTAIKKMKVKIIGLDLKEEVIHNCNAVAEKYKYDNITFEIGDIRTFQVDFPVDMVITLHACDTATDYALWNAVNWNAKMIFSAPCCQHEFNEQIKSENFSILTRYGIIKERISAAFTDAVRANLLTCCGYKTQLLEFIDSAHTPKNIMIRAVKANLPKSVKEKAMVEVLKLTSEFNLQPTLLKLLETGK